MFDLAMVALSPTSAVASVSSVFPSVVVPLQSGVGQGGAVEVGLDLAVYHGCCADALGDVGQLVFTLVL